MDLRKLYLKCLQRILFFISCTLICSNSLIAQQFRAPTKRPNVLMIVADDLNWDSPGCFGGAAKDITPNIDRLATQGIMFRQAYANAFICTPSRSVILTGLYPHNNGAEGFQRIHPVTPTLPALLNEAGYLCGTIGKPLSQQELFRWSVTYLWPVIGDENLWGRDPAVYKHFAKDFFAMAKSANQPFFLMANSHDPHRPFGGDKSTNDFEERAESSRTFSPDEVQVPGFLPDLPEIRENLAGYCTSVRRLDDMVGVVLEELTKAGLDDNTIVIFLSDQGMDFPATKFNCYLNSLRTPLIIRSPGQIKNGSVDSDHMVSTVDLQSTILEAVELIPAPVSDGRSFLPLFYRQTQINRENIFGQFYHIHGADALPMYSVLTKKYAYIFNPWFNGKRKFERLSGNPTGRAMQAASRTDTAMAARFKHLLFRTIEEFYDLRTDPNCLNMIIL